MVGLNAEPRSRPAHEIHSALQGALHALTGAHRAAVLCFSEIAARRLYRELGYSSIHHYAATALGFSPSRTAQFLRLAEELQRLPLLHEAVIRQRIGWTKALVVASIATPQTEALWLAEAERLSRPELSKRAAAVRAVAREQRAARVLTESMRPLALPPCPSLPSPPPATLEIPRRDSCPAATGALSPAPPPGAPPAPVTTPQVAPLSESALRHAAAHLPVQITLRFTPSQYARFAAQCERLRKLAARGAAGLPRECGREEMLLVALDELTTNLTVPLGARAVGSPPRPRAAEGSPYLIIIHECETCGQASVPAPDGPRPLVPAAHAAARCDGRVIRKDGTLGGGITPALRRRVLARDGWRCQAPGCGRTRFLEVHHRTPQAAGGANDLANLVTLCSACHQLGHERGSARSGTAPPGAQPYFA